MLRGLFFSASVLLVMGCRVDFDDPTDPIVGTWELRSVDGFEGCTAVGGELEIAAATNGSFLGDFEWNGTCTMGDDIMEAGKIESIDVEDPGREYSIDLRLSIPSDYMADWDCTLDEPELTCIETGAPVLVFEFERETGA